MPRHVLSRALGAITALALVAGGIAVTAAPATAAAKKGSITGVITGMGDEEGSSVGEDGVVYLSKASSSTLTGYKYVGSFGADSNGAYKIPNLAAGKYSLSFSSYSELWLTESWNNIVVDSIDTVVTPINLKAGQKFVANADLVRGASISGVISGDDTDGEPLQAAEVYVYDAVTGDYEASGWHDQDAETYTAKRIRPGNYKLRFESGESDYYLGEWYGGEDEASATVVTITGHEDLVDFDTVLTRGATISGIGLTPERDEYSIRASAYDVDGDVVATSWVDEFDGEFELTKLEAGTYRVGFSSSATSPLKIVPEFYDDVASLELADGITVELGETVTEITADFEVAAALAATPRPTISGSLKVGSLLTAKTGVWKPAGVTFDYEWYVAGELVGTDPTYTVQPADAGSLAWVTVLGSLEGYGPMEMTSKTTTAIAKGTITAITPKLTGTAKVGSTLTAISGEWKPTSATLAYTWLRAGKVIAGQTASSYTLAAADKGKKISVKVTATGAGLTSKSATSKPKLVGAGVLVAPAAPVISGTVTVGETLTAMTDAWGPEGTTLSYQWKSNKKAITGATASTLVVPGTAAGTKLTVTITGKKAGFTSVSKTSVTTAAVLKADLVAGDAPTIDGNATSGSTLTASATGWNSSTKLSYQWLRSGAKIAGATKSTYVITRADRGHAITVSLVASRTGYNSLTIASAAALAIPAVMATVDSEPYDWAEGDGYSVYIYETTPKTVTVAGGEYFEFQAEPGFFAMDELDVAYTWTKGNKYGGKSVSAVEIGEGSGLRVKVPTGSTLATLKAKKKAGYTIELQVLGWANDYEELKGVFTVIKF